MPKKTLFLLSMVLAACGGGGGSNSPAPDPGNGAPPSGLAERPNNSSCVAKVSSGDAVALQTVFSSLPSNNALVGLYQAPNSSEWFYAVHQSGHVYRFANQANVSNKSLFLDVTQRVDFGGESGLLGFAFDPDYANNRRFYIYYTGGDDLTSYLERYTATSDFASVEPQSRTVLLTLDQPYGNHNGGQIAFGPDGYLYIGLGDGGSGGDPQGNGQNLNALLGKVLRIDVRNGGTSYQIPADNPFASGGGRAEIFAYGLRNPWRFSFDRATGKLWLADVGQNMWEEINIVENGDNLGWNLTEGDHCYTPNCDKTGLKAPVYEYSHDNGCSVTGGFVYRGSAIAGLQGQYLFSDFCSATLWRLQQNDQQQWQRFTIAPAGGPPAAFTEDSQGEIYLLIYNGTIKKLVAAGSGESVTPAEKLSETGCVSSTDPKQPATGLIPYTINSPFWSDGADKTRYLGLPNNTTINVQNTGDLLLPVGSVLVKNFSLAGTVFETRLLMHHGSHWQGYSYRWQSDGLDAVRQDSALVTDVQGQQWLFPSAAQCQACHTDAAKDSLGLTLGQLNKSLLYPSTQITANQLDTWQHIALFSSPLSASQRQQLLPDFRDGQYSLSQRARAYLDSNCAHCHQPGGPTSVAIDLRYATALSATGICDQPPQAGDLGIANARILAPGAPERSTLWQRMQRLDQFRMPPLSSFQVDQQGAGLIRDFIVNTANCS